MLLWNLPSSSTEEDVGLVGAAPRGKGKLSADVTSSVEFSIQREIKWGFYFIFFKETLSIELFAVRTGQ